MCILQQSLKTTGFWYFEEVADDIPASKSMKLNQTQTSCFFKMLLTPTIFSLSIGRCQSNGGEVKAKAYANRINICVFCFYQNWLTVF